MGTSELVEISSQREILPDSSSGQSMSESRDKREFSCSDLSHHQPSTNSPKPSTSLKPQDFSSSSATTHQRPLPRRRPDSKLKPHPRRQTLVPSQCTSNSV